MAGIRDRGLLESAIARPQNATAYNEDVAIAELAALYALGIAKNHPFVDGNKRAAFIALELFLKLNGHRLDAADVDAYTAIMQIAGNASDEDAFIAWVRTHAIPMRD